MEWLIHLSAWYGTLIIFVCLLMFFTSIYERQKKAALKAFISLSLAIPFYLNLLIHSDIINWITIIITTLTTLFLFYLLIPGFLFKKDKASTPTGQIDERTIMFSRNELTPDTDRFKTYYKKHPEHQPNDDYFRTLPGLLSENSRFYKTLPFLATTAIFQTIDALQPLVEGNANSKKTNLSTNEIQTFISSWLKNNAHSVGYTQLKYYHWYSVGGRGERYGKAIDGKHTTAIAFTVEMTKEMVNAAPRSSIIMESASKYLEAGVIAVQLAGFLRQNGYDARAHIDGNYQVVAPLVARDAGLGEIGRMGILMDSKLGPRVRIGIVTTNLQLESSVRRYDRSVEDFCKKCKKCAINCPGNAIPHDNQKDINGVRRWQINSESCFNYWCIAGTDCGRCMSTCPYSHPNNLLHNTVRWTIHHFPNFRYWAVRMDDYFYGKKPSPAALPQWMN